MAALEIQDPEGRVVFLHPSRWRHIVDRGFGHLEMASLQLDVLEAVRAPDHRRIGREPNEEWFYREGIGPNL
jgi:hypothetical protein